jgi:hypothetical protein
MIDIVDRLRFDAVRCELTFSKGVAGNIVDAINEIERLRAELAGLTRDDIEAPHPDAAGQTSRD